MNEDYKNEDTNGIEEYKNNYTIESEFRAGITGKTTVENYNQYQTIHLQSIQLDTHLTNAQYIGRESPNSYAQGQQNSNHLFATIEHSKTNQLGNFTHSTSRYNHIIVLDEEVKGAKVKEAEGIRKTQDQNNYQNYSLPKLKIDLKYLIQKNNLEIEYFKQKKPSTMEELVAQKALIFPLWQYNNRVWEQCILQNHETNIKDFRTILQQNLTFFSMFQEACININVIKLKNLQLLEKSTLLHEKVDAHDIRSESPNSSAHGQQNSNHLAAIEHSKTHEVVGDKNSTLRDNIIEEEDKEEGFIRNNQDQNNYQNDSLAQLKIDLEAVIQKNNLEIKYFKQKKPLTMEELVERKDLIFTLWKYNYRVLEQYILKNHETNIKDFGTIILQQNNIFLLMFQETFTNINLIRLKNLQLLEKSTLLHEKDKTQKTNNPLIQNQSNQNLIEGWQTVKIGPNNANSDRIEEREASTFDDSATQLNPETSRLDQDVHYNGNSEDQDTGCFKKLCCYLLCCLPQNKSYRCGGVIIYSVCVSAIILGLSLGLSLGYPKNHKPPLSCTDNSNQNYPHGANLTMYGVINGELNTLQKQCYDGELKQVTLSLSNSKDCFLPSEQEFSVNRIEPYLKNGERNNATLQQCTNGKIEDLYRFNCEGKSNVTGQPVPRVNFTSSFSEALINALEKTKDMKNPNIDQKQVSDVKIGDKIYKILLGAKLDRTDLMKEIQVSYQKFNTTNSNYTQSLNCSLSQNTCFNRTTLVTPTATLISAKVNDITIFKDKKWNDVALIKDEYRTIHMIPATADNNQTRSLYYKFDTLKWNEEKGNSVGYQNNKADINKQGKQIIFTYANNKLQLSTNSEYNLKINGVKVESDDITKCFQEVLFGKTFASGTYGAFCQQFIKEKGFFACDEIFTEEQTKAIVAKGIIDKVADEKQTGKSAEAIATLTMNKEGITNATTFDAWRNTTLNNLNAIMSSPFKPFTFFNVSDAQKINATCVAKESNRVLSVDYIDPRYNDRYQEQDLPLSLRQTIKNLYTNRGRGLEGDESQQAFKPVDKKGKHDGKHNGFLQGEDNEATAIQPQSEKQSKKQSKGIGGRN